tara:strand:- start:356 stop:643 length:288 start_codon:yes stop_codon:yes gene_type:complete
MNKYLKIPTGAGNHNIPVGNGLFVERTSGTAMRIYSSAALTHHYALITVASTAAMIAAIDAAIEKAAVTPWHNAEVLVNLPSGETVTSITMTVFS